MPYLGPTAYYEQRLQEGEFLIQRCAACTKHVYYPRVVCCYCDSPTLEWVSPCGGAVVYAVTVIERAAAKGGPYNVVLVDLDEGVRLMSRVAAADGRDISIGMRVVARLDQVNGRNQLVFTPQDEAAV